MTKNNIRGGNVVPFPRALRRDPAGAAFEQLTAVVVMERHRRGELDPAIVAALLQGVGLEVPR